jgi:hypothetical protein
MGAPIGPFQDGQQMQVQRPTTGTAALGSMMTPRSPRNVILGLTRFGGQIDYAA